MTDNASDMLRETEEQMDELTREHETLAVAARTMLAALQGLVEMEGETDSCFGQLFRNAWAAIAQAEAAGIKAQS